MSKNTPLILAAALLFACSDRPLGETATEATTDSGGTDPTTSGPTTATSTTSEPTTTTDSHPHPSTDPTTGTTASDPTATDSTLSPTSDTSDPSDTDVAPPDQGPGVHCDIWDEDCTEGQKCMPVSLDGDSAWESLSCVPIAPEPDALNEPCQLLGTGLDGLDTCEQHTMCWNVDPDTGEGTCLGLCTGTPETPTCADPGAVCQISGEGVLNLCIPKCDPLEQDCPDGEACIPNNNDAFVCVFDVGGDEGQAFDPCAFANVCDPGLYCLDPALASECDPKESGCCLPFCDLDAPNTCPGAGQECVPWFEEGQAPPEHEDLGVCGLPMP